MIATSGQPLPSDSPAPSAPMVTVNQEQCRRLAALISSQTIPQDREDSSLTGFSQEAAGNFYFLLVAICHQTSPVGKPPLEGYIDGRLMHGWDYLTARLEAAVRSDPSLLVPSTWSKVQPDQLAQIFRDDRLGERLTGVPHRAELIRDLGDVLSRENRDCVQRLFESAAGRIAGAAESADASGSFSRFQ